MLTGGGPGDEAAELNDFHGALYADLLEHVLDSLAHLDAGLVVVDPQGGGEAVGIAGLSQQVLGLLRIVLTHAGGVVAEHARGDDGVGGLTAAGVDGVDDELTVDGVAQSLTDQGIVEGLLVHVHGDVPAGQRGDLIHGELGRISDLGDVVHRQVIGQVDLAGLQGDGALGGLGDNAHDQVLGGGLAGIVVVKSLQGDMVALLPFHELVGAGTHGIEDEGILVSLHHGLGNDGREGDGQVAQGGSVGGLGLDGHGVLVIHSNSVDEVHDIGHSGGIDRPVQRELHVLGGQITAIVELDALTNLEHVGQIVSLLPALGNLALDLVGLGVHDHQSVENLAGDFHSRGLLALVGVKGSNIGALSPGQGVLIAGGSTVAAGAGTIATVAAAAIAAAGREGEHRRQSKSGSQNTQNTLFHVLSSYSFLWS